VEKVRIIKINRQIKVKFRYNEDLVEIMQSFGGYWNRKERAWFFPAYKKSELKDELTRRMYDVVILG
jgi:hypothetical protein